MPLHGHQDPVWTTGEWAPSVCQTATRRVTQSLAEANRCLPWTAGSYFPLTAPLTPCSGALTNPGPALKSSGVHVRSA